MTATRARVARPLLRRALLANLAIALGVGLALLAAAFATVWRTAERAALLDIEAELRVLERRYDELKVVAFADGIEFRTGARVADEDERSFYLLTYGDGKKVTGNLAQWPMGHALAAGTLRFDGTAAGVAPGRIVATARLVDGRFPLLVGRRLESVDALLRELVPIAGVLLLGTALLAWAVTRRMERLYASRIAATNAVFAALNRGALGARVPDDVLAADDELALLARNVNKALAEIERLVKGLDSVSQAAAHELNRELSRLRDEGNAAGAPRLVAAVDQLIELLRQILALARIEATPGFALGSVAADALVAEAAALYRDAFESAGVALESDSAALGGARFHGSTELVKNAVLNLLDNALKHAPEGSRVRLVAAADEHSVTLEVADEGPGAPSEELAELVAAGSRGPVEGYGFGLRLVQAVAIRHGARVALRNTEPGFRVTLRFPRVPR